MENPFDVINLRLNNIEELLLDIKHGALEAKPVIPKFDEALFLTKKQAARKLNCSTSTIDNYARAGSLTRHYLGKTVRFKLEEVLALAKPVNN